MVLLLVFLSPSLHLSLSLSLSQNDNIQLFSLHFVNNSDFYSVNVLASTFSFL